MLNTMEHQIVNDVLAAQQGHQQAFARLVSRSQQLVSSIAMSVLRDLDASDEVAQQVFIYLWQHINELREPSSFLPWVRQITRSRALNYIRDHKLNQRIGGDDADAMLAEFVDPDANPEAWHGRVQQSQLLSQFLDALPADSRDLVLLYYREEQNSQQVADLLGISEANVRKKLQRIREALKEQWLTRYGQLILSTAPGIGFSSALALALAGVSQPVAAAALSSATASSTVSTAASSGTSKVAAPSMLALIGGATIGAFMALAAVYYGMQPAINRADTAELQQALQRLRQKTMLGMAACALAWVGSYELTSGWLGPVVSFALINLLLVLHTVALNRLLLGQRQREASIDPTAAARRQRRDRIACILGFIGGFGAGWWGLIYGLIQAGRW